MKLHHVTKRSVLLSLAPVPLLKWYLSHDPTSVFYLPSPATLVGNCLFQRCVAVVAIVVGSVSAISLAFCISCLESPRCLLKPYLNMINHKKPPNLKDKKKKKNLREGKTHQSCYYISYKLSGLGIWRETNCRTLIFISECLLEQGVNKTQVHFVYGLPWWFRW